MQTQSLRGLEPLVTWIVEWVLCYFTVERWDLLLSDWLIMLNTNHKTRLSTYLIYKRLFSEKSYILFQWVCLSHCFFHSNIMQRIISFSHMQKRGIVMAQIIWDVWLEEGRGKVYIFIFYNKKWHRPQWGGRVPSLSDGVIFCARYLLWAKVEQSGEPYNN